jgi:3-hydroxyacyl-CoA dehydrogenase
VAIFDAGETARTDALRLIGEALELSKALLPPSTTIDDVRARIRVATTLADAVVGADYIQEAVPENLALKQAVHTEIDAHARPDAIIASSSSSFGVSRFAGDIAGRERIIVAHPATPPHLLRVVEVAPAPWTPQSLVSLTFDFQRACDQVPVLIKKEQPSFVMNRLQGALLIEMFRAISDGVMSPEDVDKLISEGFGLRWAFLGPLEGIDLNAPGGIADYLARYGFMFDDLARERGMQSPVVNESIVNALHAAMRAQLPASEIGARTRWRDQAIAALRQLKDSRD